MRDDINREGLTFVEWVCAAGVATFNQGLVRPYSESETYYTMVEERWCGMLRERGVKRKRSTVHYPKKIRQAWKSGEDPTEWRAQLVRG